MLLSTATILTFGLFVVRAGALVMASPALSSRIGFGAVEIALVVSLALASFAAWGGATVETDVGIVPYAAMAARELVIGLFLAFLLHLVMQAARLAGQVVGLEMGLQMAHLVDPESGQATPLLARLHEELFLVAFLVLEGHVLLVRSLAESFRRAPVGEMRIDGRMGPFVVSLFGEMFAAGVAFAAPILALIGLLTVALGLIARTVPQINVLELGFTLRIALSLFALFLFMPLLEPTLARLFTVFEDWTARGLDLIATR